MEIQDISCACGLLFHRFSRMKKHMENSMCHIIIDKSKCENEQVLNLEPEYTDVGKVIYQSIEALQENSNNDDFPMVATSNSSCAIDSLANISQLLSDLSINFLVDLHAKSNFCRSDVTLIQNSVSHFLLKISEVLHQNFEYLIPFEKKPFFKNVLEKISEPFKNIHSEYLFLKKLKECNLMEDPTNFLINEEIGVVFSKGESDFNSIETRGMLLPIRFQFKKFLDTKIEEMLENKKKIFC